MASRAEDEQDLKVIAKIKAANLEWKASKLEMVIALEMGIASVVYEANMRDIELAVFRTQNLINLRFRRQDKEERISRQRTSNGAVTLSLDVLFDTVKEISECPAGRRILINEILEGPEVVPNPQAPVSTLSNVEIDDFDRRL